MKPENRRILKAFARHVLEEEFDVAHLVPILRAWELINGNESDRLENAVTRSERSNILLLEIFPTKDDSAIDQLLNAVYKAGAKTIAEYLLHLIDEGIPEETTAPPSPPTVASTSSRVRTALKEQWNRGAGKKNRLFTGRGEILEDVRRTFKSEDTSNSISAVCLSGMGGLGKTSIALEFSYRDEKNFSFLAWLKADSTGRFLEEMEALGEALGIPPRPNKKDVAASIETVQAVRIRLGEHPGWLVVLDDLSEEVLEVLEEVLPNSGGCVLITSRIRISVDWISRINVGQLNESTELLGKVIGTTKPTDFDERKEELANDKLGCLPLAIMHAGSYIKQRSICVADYLERLQGSAEILNKKLHGVQFSGPQQVLTTWNLTMDHLRKESKDSFLFLSICSFLASSINDSIMCTAPGFKLSFMERLMGRFLRRTAKSTKERVEDAKVVLLNFSMVDSREDGINIHVLVQEAALLYSTFEENVVGFSNAVSIMEGIYDEHKDSGNPQPLRTCFEHSEAMINKFHRKFADQTVQVLSSRLKNDYYSLSFPFLVSAFRLGVKVPPSLLEIIQEQVQSLFGNSSAQTASVINNIALLVGQQGDHNKEMLLLERVLKIEEPIYGPNHVEVARTLGNLGNCYGDLGDHHRKKEMLERALQIRKSFYGENHFQVALTLMNLGICYGDLGDHHREKEMLERALQIRKSFYGENHVQVAITMHNLGSCYGDLGDHHRMKEMLERALQIQKSFYGENHFEVAKTLPNLGICYGNLGDHHRKKEMLERALQIEKSFYGENHVEVARTLHNLGMCYRSLKKYPQSIAFLKQAIEIKERGSSVYSLRISYRQIAISLIEGSLDKDSLLEAKEYLKKERALLSENLDHPKLNKRLARNKKKQEEVDSLLKSCVSLNEPLHNMALSD